MIFRAELSQNRQFRIIFEIQASNPVRNSKGHKTKCNKMEDDRKRV